MNADDELDQRIRAQRPRAGWTMTSDGVRAWDAVGDPRRGGRRSDGGRSWHPAVAAGLAVVAIAAAMLAFRGFGPSADVATPRPTNGSVVTIEQGLTYDAENLPVVMANTDTVFVGTVLGTAERDEDAGWTTFAVSVAEPIAGQPTAEVQVRQRGYVDRQGTLHIIEDQSLVEVGGTYMFATNYEPSLDVYTVAPGPWAARPTEPEGQATLVEQYEAAL